MFKYLVAERLVYVDWQMFDTLRVEARCSIRIGETVQSDRPVGRFVPGNVLAKFWGPPTEIWSGEVPKKGRPTKAHDVGELNSDEEPAKESDVEDDAPVHGIDPMIGAAFDAELDALHGELDFAEDDPGNPFPEEASFTNSPSPYPPILGSYPRC